MSAMALETASQAISNPQAYATLAKTLPNILIRFFQKFPPGQPYAKESQKPELPQPITITQTAEDGSAVPVIQEPSKKAILRASIPFADPSYNPFLPWRNPVTLRWRGPYYGLRRQAVLCKTAAQFGVEELLPWSMKLPAVKLARREERGLRMRGTGEGERVKGHAWERGMKSKVKTRKTAMEDMAKVVREWKEVCIGYGEGVRGIDVLTRVVERAWTRVEEVAEMSGWLNGICWIYTRWLSLLFTRARKNSFGIGLGMYGIAAHFTRHLNGHEDRNMDISMLVKYCTYIQICSLSDGSENPSLALLTNIDYSRKTISSIDILVLLK